MSFRVVIPREIPSSDSNRVQREVWKRGYSTRLRGREPATPGHVRVEFLRLFDELPDPSDVGGLEHDLEQVLAGGRIRSSFLGTGAFVETVQRPPRSA